MPIHREGSGWQWGSHGAVYASREGAARQAAAAHAHGYTGDTSVRGAGIVFLTPEGKALFLRRSDASDHPGEWCLPGGTAEADERPIDTARRECIEEIGDVPEGHLELLAHLTSDEGVEFSTFRQLVNYEFEPELNHEHTDYMWASTDAPPEPLHPGVRRLLDTPAQDDFKESEHPRAENGQFGEGGGGAAPKTTRTSSHETTQVVNRQRVTAAGKPLPAHIAALKIPPAWTDVSFDPNPEAELLATGKDSKGRKQAVYSTAFSEKQAAAKFARINELNDKFESIFRQNEAARKSKDPKTKAAADCARLIMTTGIRPGSEGDTGAAQKAYGATTLEGKHVVVKDGQVSLQFVGKKGVSLNIPVRDPGTAKMLVERKAASGDSKQLFPINEKLLLDHVHSFDGGSFKTKDFRTLLGTKTAMDEVAKVTQKPADAKSYRKAVMSVAKIVAERLGNTPIIALQSYISPAAFADWRISA